MWWCCCIEVEAEPVEYWYQYGVYYSGPGAALNPYLEIRKWRFILTGNGFISSLMLQPLHVEQGSILTSARLVRLNIPPTDGVFFHNYAPQAARDSCELRMEISGRAIDNSFDWYPPYELTFNEIQTAPRTLAKVEWVLPLNGRESAVVPAPNIASIINEIVGRAGWQSGNRIAIFFDQLDEILGLLRQLVAFEQTYHLSSDVFYARFMRGEMGDDLPFIKWAGRYELYLEAKQEMNQQLADMSIAA